VAAARQLAHETCNAHGNDGQEHDMRPEEILIRRGTLDEIVDLRHVILRAGLPREEAIFQGDADASSRHYAAVHAVTGQVVGCATVHLNTWQGEPAWQLRGMATDPAVRRAGVGRGLLELLEQDLRADRTAAPQLWCNARTPASGFYQRMGWEVVSEVFEIPTAGPHVRMTKRLA
jgi:GNAT superfamily N-acetyltransferase